MKGEGYDLNYGPVVLVQVRWKLALAILGCFVFILPGIWKFPSQPAIDERTVACVLAVGVFGLFAILGAVALARPSQLTIEPRGLTLETAFRTRFWAWDEIFQINLVRIRMTDTLSLSTRTVSGIGPKVFAALGLPGNTGLPGAWPVRMKALHALLVGAKTRWG